jgi:hypothetical protein
MLTIIVYNKFKLILIIMSNSILISQLYENICNSLQKELYANAVFYGERLINENDSEEVKYLLAQAYIGKIYFNFLNIIFKKERENTIELIIY